MVKQTIILHNVQPVRVKLCLNLLLNDTFYVGNKFADYDGNIYSS